MRLSFAAIAYAALLLVVLLVLCPSTAGAATGRASYTSLAFQLTDLDPTDGVIPSLTWTSGGALSQLHSTPAPGDLSTFLGDSKQGIFASTDKSLGFAEARTVPDGAFSFVSASSTVGLRAETTVGQSFDLSPHTNATFSAVGHVEFAGTDGFSTKAAGAALLLGRPPIDNSRDFVDLDRDGSSSKEISASISNDSDGVLSYTFNADTYVQLNGNLPIPEPEALILLIIGLFAGGAMMKVRAIASSSWQDLDHDTIGKRRP